MNQNQPPYNYVCKICGKSGHWIQQCPFKYDPVLSQVPVNYICNKCGIPGHWIQNCTNIPPPNYVCNKCGIGGHWIQDCTNYKNSGNSVPPSNYICNWIKDYTQKPSMPPSPYIHMS